MDSIYHDYPIRRQTLIGAAATAALAAQQAIEISSGEALLELMSDATFFELNPSEISKLDRFSTFLLKS